MKSSSFNTNHGSEPSPSPIWRGGRGVRFLTLALLALFTTCCKDDCLDPTNPNCDNYDPCYGKAQPSAKFIMEESNAGLSLSNIWIPDSVFYGTMIRFRSEYTDDKYKHTWYVGTETFYKAITPHRNFNNQARPQYITISHVLEYTPDLQCFPDDDGKDSVAQQFRLIASLNDDFQTYGIYRGALNGGVDSFDVEVISIDINGQRAAFNTHYDDVIINFHNNGDTIQSNSGKVAGFFYNHHGYLVSNFSQVVGQVAVFANGTFLWSYQATNPNVLNGDVQKHEFKGRKIK